MTKPVTPELIHNIVEQRHLSVLEVLEKLCSEEYKPFGRVAPNPGQSAEECLTKLGENLDDYNMGEVYAALGEREALLQEKEEELRQQEMANKPHRYVVVCFEDKVGEDILSVFGVTMSDNNNYVELELYSESSGNIMSHTFTSKEHVEHIIAQLQEATKVFSH
jgi:hypothetical protein